MLLLQKSYSIFFLIILKIDVSKNNCSIINCIIMKWMSETIGLSYLHTELFKIDDSILLANLSVKTLNVLINKVQWIEKTCSAAADKKFNYEKPYPTSYGKCGFWILCSAVFPNKCICWCGFWHWKYPMWILN